MKHLTLEFSDDETTLERLTAKARDKGFTPQQWVQRLIARDLGDYQLKPLPEGSEFQSLPEIFAAIGILKPRK